MSRPGRPHARCFFLPPERLRAQRWDPGYWRPAAADRPEACRLDCLPLGHFVDHITYGPIVTGRRPTPAPGGVAIIDQRAIRPTGVALDRAVRVAEGCEFDLPRCRLRTRDIVFARSGAGTLARKRFTVFDRRLKATVSCFVDLIRLRDISPYYVVTFLRTPQGWSQIERLLNGVGTPNISFGELRSLAIPQLPAEEQAEIDAAWEAIRRAHRRGRLGRARHRLEGLVRHLEARLRGQATGGRRS